MKLEVLLSTMNLEKADLKKMNISSKCTVINQCKKNDFKKYNNFNIYSYNEVGLSNSRNHGLEHVTEEIIILCDDDVVYNYNYENIILNEFKNNIDADIIIFNIDSPNRKMKMNKKNKKIHIFNALRYSSQRIAFKRKCISNIKFNTLFGARAKYESGEDTLFLVDCLKKKLNIYASTKNIGTVYHEKSTWFNGYNYKYFFDKGALFTAINYNLRYFLMFQYLLRHKEVLVNYSLFSAFKIMCIGSKDYRKVFVNEKSITS